MTSRPLLLLASLLAASPARALGLTTNQSQLLRNLEQEAAQDPASAASAEAARERAGRAFEAPTNIKVRVLAPEGYVDPPAQPRPAPARSAAPEVRGGLAPDYHFVPRRTALPNLTIYKPEQDVSGRDNSTKAPSKRSWLRDAVTIAGAGALVAGLVMGNPLIAAIGGAVALVGLLWRFLSR